jgi:hypothetical protein
MLSDKPSKTAQLWRVLSGISALEDKSTFMPVRKKRPGECRHLERKIMKKPITSTMLIVVTLTWFALSPAARAICRDGCEEDDNTFLGEDALSLTTGGANTAVGWHALNVNTTGALNTATGADALAYNTTGNYNTAIGEWALIGNSTGSNNTASGGETLVYNTTGGYNTANGYDALYSNSTGSYNTATGADALSGGPDYFDESTASFNTADGAQALYSITTGQDNLASGYQALYSNTTGSYNTANGVQALYSNTTGISNTANGTYALFTNTTGFNNTANGVNALFSNTTGNENAANGNSALSLNTTGLHNTAEGSQALLRNTTGNNNIALGFQAGQNLTTGSSNIHIGNAGVAGDSRKIRIGTQGTQNSAFVAGIYGVTVSRGIGVIVDSDGHLGTTTSSARFKDEIKPMDKASEAILALEPVTFRYKKELDPDGIPQFGLVAEQVAKVNPDLVARDEEGKPYTVRYEAVNAMLLNEFLKEHRKNEQQEAKIADQQKQIEALTESFKEQAAQMQKVSARLVANQSSPRIVINDQSSPR